jgi:hypothetical protein
MPLTCRLVLIALVLLAGGAGAVPGGAVPLVAHPAPPELVAELAPLVEHARQRFEARDAPSVLALVSERYRSGGLTKPMLREQLRALFAAHDALRTRVRIEQVQIVEGSGVWIFTTGEVTGRLPLVGWVTVLAWQNEPEVVRREPDGWRLIGFQT